MQNSHQFFDSLTEQKGVRAMIILVLLLLSLFLFAETIKAIKETTYVGYDAASSNSITVSGKGEVKAVPDMATFSFSAQADGKTQAEAQTLMATKANAAISYLKEQGIAAKDIQTSDYSVSQKYETEGCTANTPCIYNGGRQVAVGFTASESINITLHDLSNSGTILRSVADKGATNVSGLSLSIDNKEGLMEQAREKAIDNAKSEAKKLARDLGVHLIAIQSFSQNVDGGPVTYFKSAAMDSAASSPVVPQIETGQNTVVSNVTITYRIR